MFICVYKKEITSPIYQGLEEYLHYITHTNGSNNKLGNESESPNDMFSKDSQVKVMYYVRMYVCMS